jgi:hypothetical protein
MRDQPTACESHPCSAVARETCRVSESEPENPLCGTNPPWLPSFTSAFSPPGKRSHGGSGVSLAVLHALPFSLGSLTRGSKSRGALHPDRRMRATPCNPMQPHATRCNRMRPDMRPCGTNPRRSRGLSGGMHVAIPRNVSRRSESHRAPIGRRGNFDCCSRWKTKPRQSGRVRGLLAVNTCARGQQPARGSSTIGSYVCR